jgi:chromosome segregation ATPase
MPTPQEKLAALERQSAEQEKQLQAIKAEWDEVSRKYGETTEAARDLAQRYEQIAETYARARQNYEAEAATLTRTTASYNRATNAWGVASVLMVVITVVAACRGGR